MQPVATIAFDATALTAHAAAVSAAGPGGAIDGARFAADLARMSQTLKEECGVLQSHLAQVSAHTKSTAKQFRANKDAMMQGAVAAAQQAAAAANNALQQQQLHQAHLQQQPMQTHYEQQRYQQMQR